MNDRELADTFRRILRQDRWTITRDGTLLHIDDTVDLEPEELAAIQEETQ